MDERTKELIAVGAAVGAHCQPCLTHHVAKAKEQGIGEDEIREAIAVGQMVERGSVSAMREFAAGIFDAKGSTGASCCPGASPRKRGCCA